MEYRSIAISAGRVRRDARSVNIGLIRTTLMPMGCAISAPDPIMEWAKIQTRLRLAREDSLLSMGYTEKSLRDIEKEAILAFGVRDRDLLETEYGVVQVIPDKPITMTRMSVKPDEFFNKRLKLTKEKADAKDKRNDSIQVSQAR